MKTISFSIERYELEEINNSQFAKLKLYICHDLDNKNGSYISFDTMKEAESTLWNKPIIMKLNKFGTDFEEHEVDVVIVGMIPQIGSNIHYEEISGRNYLVADAIIWKYYSSATLEIFERDKTKGISMEIQVIEEHKREEDGFIQLDSYAYLAVCLLGNSYETGMYRTTAQAIGFSTNNTVESLNKEWASFIKNEIKNKKVSSSERLKIRKSSLDTNSWSNPEGKLNKSLEASNCNPVLKETYIIVEDDIDINLTASEFSAIENLTKEVEEVKMPIGDEKKEVIDQVESEQNKFTANEEVKEEMAKSKVEDEEKEDPEEEKTETPDEEKKEEMCSTGVMSEDMSKDKFEDMAKSDEENKDDAKQTWSTEELGLEYTKLLSKFEDLTAKMAEKDTAMLSLNSELMSVKEENEKFSSEFESLKKYKSEVEKSEKFEKLKDTFSALVNVLTKEEIDEWKVKSESCEDISIFEREIKSFACDKILKTKEDSGITKFSNMAVNLDANDDNESEDDNVWNRITKRVSK